MFRLTSPDDRSEYLFHDPGSVVETLTQVLVVCLLPFMHSQAVTPTRKYTCVRNHARSGLKLWIHTGAKARRASA